MVQQNKRYNIREKNADIRKNIMRKQRMYPREQYLNKIISKKDNGRIKIITGLRRSGKSVLLFQLYRDWLISEGIHEDHIIALALDIWENAKYRNPIELDKYVRDRMVADGEKYYIFIDEIQFVAEIQNPYVDNPDAKISFIDVVLGFMQMKNADVRKERYDIYKVRSC